MSALKTPVYLMRTPRTLSQECYRVPSVRRYVWLVTLIVAMLLPLSVFALGLQEAKSQLLVGESVTGYLGAVPQGAVEASASVAVLVNDINAKRKASYQKIAKRNGASLTAVEQLAAKKAIEKTVSGQMIQLSPGGAWLRK